MAISHDCFPGHAQSMSRIRFGGVSSTMIGELLRRSGYRVHGRRADCAKCRGSARLTVSFTDSVGFCHRCKWRTHIRQLAKALGEVVEPESPAYRHARYKADQFEKWLDELQVEVTDEYRRLGRIAALAKSVLVHYPNCEPAWDVLARFYHAEARLASQLDALSFEKTSPWLESPADPFVLFQKWEATNAVS